MRRCPPVLNFRGVAVWEALFINNLGVARPEKPHGKLVFKIWELES